MITFLFLVACAVGFLLGGWTGLAVTAGIGIAIAWWYHGQMEKDRADAIRKRFNGE